MDSRGIHRPGRHHAVSVQPAEVYGSAPYDPEQEFPELPGRPGRPAATSPVYAAVRNLLRDLDLDAARADTPAWNPLREWVSAGAVAVVNPTWPLSPAARGTHAAVIRPILDYLALAMDGRGRIWIAGPGGSVDPRTVRLARQELAAVADATRNRFSHSDHLQIEFLEFGQRAARPRRPNGLRHEDERINLGPASLHAGCPSRWSRYRALSAAGGGRVRGHRQDAHEYRVPRAVLAANLLISAPRLMTDGHLGVAFALSNLARLHSDPAGFPVYTQGAPWEQGDERGERWPPAAGAPRDAAASRTRTPPAPGRWYGNDTCWRSVLDMVRIILGARLPDPPHPGRHDRHLIVGDALWCGEGDGPEQPLPRKLGLLFGGINPAAVDHVAAAGMGFDPARLPVIRNAPLVTRSLWPECGGPAQVRADREFHRQYAIGLFPTFQPPAGWRGHVEKALLNDIGERRQPPDYWSPRKRALEPGRKRNAIQPD